jgi:hypothetical protein
VIAAQRRIKFRPGGELRTAAQGKSDVPMGCFNIRHRPIGDLGAPLVLGVGRHDDGRPALFERRGQKLVQLAALDARLRARSGGADRRGRSLRRNAMMAKRIETGLARAA